MIATLLAASVRADEPTPITDPDFDPPVTAATHPVRAPQRKVLYINFDGGVLDYCGPGIDDPVDNCSTIFQGAVMPYSGDATNRAAVVQALRQDLADFDVVVTTERPRDDVAYDMEMVGDWYPLVNVGFAGIAPKIDCFDADGGDVSFTLDMQHPQVTAKVILQELAHTWGLEHVDSPSDLLYPITLGAVDPAFEARCSPIVRLGGGLVPTEARCPEQHAMHCETPDHQSSHADILALFGPAVSDTEPPTVAILSPDDGASPPGAFHLVIEITDTLAPQTYATTIEIGDLYATELQLTGPGVFPIGIDALPDDTYPLRVTAHDEAGNAAIAEIAIVVGEPAAGDDTDAESSGAPPPDPDSGETTQQPATDGDTTGNIDGSDEGCGCRTDARRDAPALLVIAIAAGSRRRRAAARRER